MSRRIVSELIFILAQELRHPYTRYDDHQVMTEREELQVLYRPWGFPAPVVLTHMEKVCQWLWLHKKDAIHYQSLARWLFNHSREFTAIDWQFAVYLLETYYVNRRLRKD